VRLAVDVPREPSDAVAATAYFATCEALANVAKHARATDVSISVGCGDGRLRVTITDDGVGGADPAAGSGLRGIADRIAAVGGTLHVHSRAERGTIVEVELPCASS
jgi:signal transduction histidine kinase